MDTNCPPEFTLARDREAHRLDHMALHRRYWQHVYSDDYASLQDAIDAAIAKMLPLVIAPRVHPQVTTLRIANASHLTIWAQGATVRWDSAIDVAIELEAVTRCHIEGLQVVGADVVGTGIACHDMTHTVFDSLAVTHCDIGIAYNGSNWCNVQRDTMCSYGRIGLYMDGMSGQNNANVFQGVSASGNSEYGVRSLAGASTRFFGCQFEHNALAGMYLTRGLSTSILYSHFEANGTIEARGTQVLLGDDGVIGVTSPNITGNYFWGGKYATAPAYCDYALVIERATNALIAGNYARGHELGGRLYDEAVTFDELANDWA